MGNCTCERENEEKGRGSKNGIVSHRTAPALQFIFGPLLKLFFSTVREPFFCKFPLITISAAFSQTHYRCTSNPTYKKAVRPDGGRRNHSGTFPTVVDGKY